MTAPHRDMAAADEINTALIDMLNTVDRALAAHYPESPKARQNLRKRTLHYAADMHQLLREAQGRKPQ